MAEQNKTLWQQLRESNVYTKLGACIMAVGLGTVAFGSLAHDVSLQIDGQTYEVNHDVNTGLFLGGIAVLLAGQQVLIRGHRQEVREQSMNNDN